MVIKMFKVGDIVKYGMNGICTVTDITVRDFLGTEMEYYVLKTATGFESTFFVPVANEALTSKMQYLLSKEEAYSVIGDINEGSIEWIEDDKERASIYGKLLTSKDRRDLLRLVSLLYMKKREFEAKGKKLHIADERIMNEAERIISDELSTVFGIKKSDVPAFIESHLNK